ncbi:MAG TPA: sugar phosphate isomerase/epimerase family protein [Candidatus Limnocylindria bacterium]|nr:sugar phosphate isomerase/epimerase family protein [Candidatus Limnocylindria bacterium]
MKVGLYSISYSGTWYNDKPALTVEEVIDKAKKYGYDGVEIDLKRPHGSPIDLDERRCAEIRAYAEQQGIEICGVAANNNFASPVPEHIENELLMVREQIRVARQLGAPVLRLFAAWRGITFRNGIATYEVTRKMDHFYDSLDYEVRQRITECFRECAKWAEEAGVTLALQNHEPVIRSYTDMLDFVRWVGSPRFRCCLDAPNCGLTEKTQSDEYLEQAVKDVGDLQTISHANGELREEDGRVVMFPYEARLPIYPNYRAFIRALAAQGYEGYINYEFCHMPFYDGKVLGFAYVDRQVELAQRYFRDLIQEAQAMK